MNILAVGVHISSVLFLAGGTLARYAQEGHRITVAATYPVTRAHCSKTDTKELVLKRELETREAVALLPAEAVFLYTESGPSYKEKEGRRLIELINRIKPEVIITHYAADHYDLHRHTSELLAACEFAARSHRITSELLPLHENPQIIFMDTIAGLAFEPEEFVNISSVFDLKCRLLACYEEETLAWQDHPVTSWLELTEIHNRYRGIQCWVHYAEAFRIPKKWGDIQPRRILP